MRVVPDEQVERTDSICDSWVNHRSALNSVRNGSCLRYMPVFIKRIIEGELWRNIWLQPNGRVCYFDSFQEYVECHTPDGLGADIPTIKRLCRDNPEALNAIDAATQRGRGGNNPDGANQYTRDIAVEFDNVQVNLPGGCTAQATAVKAPTGNSREASLRRLRKDRPDILEKVLAGELSPHAAMIEAGFRRTKSPEEQVRHWFAKCTDKEAMLQELHALL